MFPQKKIIYAYNNTATDAIKTLAAFGKSLSQNQYLRDTLVLMQFCSKNVPASELLGVNEIVRQTNQLFGTVDSVPVHFYHQNLDKDEEKAIMMASTLAVFLGLDPLSLEKAKAYILCQHVSPPSLIVSENSQLGIPYGPLTVSNNLNAVSHLADCFQCIFTTMGAPEILQRYETLRKYISRVEASNRSRLSTALSNSTSSLSSSEVFPISNDKLASYTLMLNNSLFPNPILIASPSLAFSQLSKPIYYTLKLPSKYRMSFNLDVHTSSKKKASIKPRSSVNSLKLNYLLALSFPNIASNKHRYAQVTNQATFKNSLDFIKFAIISLLRLLTRPSFIHYTCIK
jgi:hypothetical protein